MDRADRRAELAAEDALKRCAPREDRRHAHAELRQRRRNLAADEAHSGHNCAATRNGFALDRIALGDRAQVVDPGQLLAGSVEPPVASARRDQQLLILELATVVECDRVGGGVHRDHA